MAPTPEPRGYGQPPRRRRSRAALTSSADERASRTVAALEQWLAAIHVARAERHA